MKRLVLMLLALCLLLCGCKSGKSDKSDSSVPVIPEPSVTVTETVWDSHAYNVENTSESVFGRPIISQIGSVLDLNNYLNTYGTLVDTSPAGLSEKYDEAFFENNSLVVFLLDTPNTTDIPYVDSVKNTGITTDITVLTEKGESDNTAATWLFVIETERGVYDSVVYVFVY